MTYLCAVRRVCKPCRNYYWLLFLRLLSVSWLQVLYDAYHKKQADTLNRYLEFSFEQWSKCHIVKLADRMISFSAYMKHYVETSSILQKFLTFLWETSRIPREIFQQAWQWSQHDQQSKDAVSCTLNGKKDLYSCTTSTLCIFLEFCLLCLNSASHPNLPNTTDCSLDVLKCTAYTSLDPQQPHWCIILFAKQRQKWCKILVGAICHKGMVGEQLHSPQLLLIMVQTSGKHLISLTSYVLDQLDPHFSL